MKTLRADHYIQLGVRYTNAFELVIQDIDVTLAVKKVTIPKMSTESIEVSYGNSTVYLAGKTNSGGEMSIEVRELLDADVVGSLTAWHKLTYNELTGAVGRPSEYKKNATLYRTDGEGNTIETWNIEGLWVKSIDLGDADYDTVEANTVSVSFAMDRITRADYDSIAATAINA